MFADGLHRWFNLNLGNISDEDADDYTCVGVNAGGVSEQNVSLTFDQPQLSPDTHEHLETHQNLAVMVGAAAAGREVTLILSNLIWNDLCPGIEIIHASGLIGRAGVKPLLLLNFTQFGEFYWLSFFTSCHSV